MAAIESELIGARGRFFVEASDHFSCFPHGADIFFIQYRRESLSIFSAPFEAN